MEKNFLLCPGELRIPCKLTAPDSGVIRRVVLGVHGICGSSEDPIQTRIAEEMTLFYSASYRFDFPAHGESPMDCGAFTVQNCIDTLLAVARRAKADYPETEDLCVFATGFGAYITLAAMGQLQELPGRIKLVIQTPSVCMDETLLAMMGISRETFWALDRFTFLSPRPLEVTYRFYEELRERSVMAAQSIPLLILHGEDDDFIHMADIQLFRQLNEDSKLVIIPGTSHRFMETGAWDMVLDLTRDWFEFEQVLLSDWD